MYGVIVTYRHREHCFAWFTKDNDDCNCDPLEVCRSCGGDEQGHKDCCDYNGTLSGLDDCR